MPEQQKPERIIYSTAPIRICDIGGWTDTWFAEYGTIFNIAVSPHAEVQIDVYSRNAKEHQVTLFAENYGDRYAISLGTGIYEKHPLLEAAVEYMKIPDDYAIEITLYSDAPAGGSIGTSASVTVSLIGALDLLTPGRLTPHEIAYAAQYVETKMLNLQCGIQDQLAAAYGNINFIEVFQYPHSSVSHLQIPNSLWWELNRRLILIYLGKSHQSSKVHERVIAGLEDSGSETEVLKSLRALPQRAKNAVIVGDYRALGQVMIENNELQRSLNPALISQGADDIIEIAKSYGALGWKVNGAGGDGGSITLLVGDSTTNQRNMIHAITEANPLFKHIPIHLTRHGVFAWQVEAS